MIKKDESKIKEMLTSSENVSLSDCDKIFIMDLSILLSETCLSWLDRNEIFLETFDIRVPLFTK